MVDDPDPYAKYLKPSGGASAPTSTSTSTSTAAAPAAAAAAPADDTDPYAKFLPKAPAPAASSGPAPGQPGNQTLPWFSLTGPDKVGAWVNTAIDSGTGGLADTAQGYLNKYVLGGPDADALRKQTSDLRGDIGPIGSLSADLAGYAIGPGKLKVGARLAELGGGKLLARMGGSAVENAGANVIGTLGHGDTDVGDNVRALAMGAGTGAATGMIGGQRGANAPTEGSPGWFGTSVGAKAANSPTPVLNAAKKAAFDPLETVQYDPGHFGPAFDGVTSSLSSGNRAAMSPELKSARDTVSNEMASKFRANGTITADDVAKFQRTLGSAAQNSNDARIAAQYSDALNGGLKVAPPTDWGTVTPGTNMADAVSQANLAANRSNTSADIDGWIKMAQRKPNAVPDAVDKALTDSPQFYNTHPDLPGMLQGVADAKPGIASKVGGTVGKMLGEAAIQAGAEYIGGQNPLVGGIAGAASGLLMGRAAGQLRSSALAAKLAQARHLNATGETLPLSSFARGVPGFGPMAVYGRSIAPTVGMSGVFASQPQ